MHDSFFVSFAVTMAATVTLLLLASPTMRRDLGNYFNLGKRLD